MKLEFVHRYILLGILPMSGTLLTYGIIRGLRKKLDFTEQELKDWNPHLGDPTKHVNDDEDAPMEREGGTYWNDVDTSVEFKITAGEREEIVKVLRERDEKEEVDENIWLLCDKFDIVE